MAANRKSSARETVLSRKKAAPKKPKAKAAASKRPQKSTSQKRQRRDEWGLLPQEAEFCRWYVGEAQFVGAEAARRAGYSPAAARQQASLLLTKPNVQTFIAHLKAERAKKLEISAENVLKPLILTVAADPNDLMETRRSCCRYCYGEGHRYQFTPGEFERAKEEHEKLVDAHQEDGRRRDPGEFDPKGGVGYDKRKPPHEECPECFGEGRLEVHVKDSRDLDAAGRALYAGVKTTKDGIEVKTHSRDKALELLGRHLGLFQDNMNLGLQPDNPLAEFLNQVAGKTLKPTEEPEE